MTMNNQIQHKDSTKVPEPTLRRLPWYLSNVKLLKQKGERYVSSTQISKEINIDASQIAKDLSYVNISGRTRVGYEVDALIAVLEDFLGFTNMHKAFLFGVGSLGGALLRDSGLSHFGLEIVAAFDVNPSLVGTTLNGIPIFHSDDFQKKMQEYGVHIGVLTVPIEIAQCITDTMVAGGMLTNFPTIRKAVKKMTTIDKLTADGTYSNLSKREILQISRQRAKLDKTLGSIADLTRLPSALFVIDVMKENIAVHEANRLGIPVFGIVDTNSDPTNIDFVIPANDDATKSVEVILDACCAAMIEGLEERKAEKIDMEAAGEAPANKGKKKSAKARLDKSDEEAINAAKAAAFLKEDEEA